MNSHAIEPSASPRWLHWLAVLTVCATLVLLALGAVVTTFRVGMADPIWPTYPWHLLLISWREPSAGFLVEHSHRAAGYIVGCCVIALVVGLWRCDARRWMKWLGVLALSGVIVQGLLGGFRVVLNAWLGPNLALIHGCFAQLVFALLVSIALFTSRGWNSTSSPLAPVLGGERSAVRGANDIRIQRWSLLLTVLIYGQLILGALVRHFSSPLAQRGHLLVAFAVVAGVAWLAKTVRNDPAANHSLIRATTLLTVLVALQVLLGVETWMSKYGAGVFPDLQQITTGQAIVRTLHFLLGSVIFATSIVVTLRAHRHTVPAVRLAPVRIQQLEGVA